MYDAALNRFVASGQVQATVAGGRLLADRLEFDSATRTVLATGRVRFQRGQQYLQASRLRYSLSEARGEIEDVYGVFDSDGLRQDLNLALPPSASLPPVEPITCPPAVPPPPDWHPYPWAVTGWGGQMSRGNLGQTLTFQGLRPEVLGGVGLQRRLLDGGPISFEVEANLLGHHAARQQGGGNQAVPYAPTPAQTFGEATAGLGLRLWVQPWLSLSVVEGVSVLTSPSAFETTSWSSNTLVRNYLAFEIEALVNPQTSLVGRVQQRSGGSDNLFDLTAGNNSYLVGLRYRFGQAPSSLRQPVPVPPAEGCPGAVPLTPQERDGLMPRLERLALDAPPTPAPSGSVQAFGSAARPSGPVAPGPAPATAPVAPGQAPVAAAPSALAPAGSLWTRARAAEAARAAAIARIDQRLEDVTFQQRLTAEQRVGFSRIASSTDSGNTSWGVQPEQLTDLTSGSNQELVKGTISRWRFQARRLLLTPTGIEGDRVGFTNDPFTPAQAWLDARGVRTTPRPDGSTRISATGGGRVVLEDRLPIWIPPWVTINQIENRTVFGFDQTDRDGFYLGYNQPVKFGERGRLTLQPQVLLERAIKGFTTSYPLPGQPITAPLVQQPTTLGDLFGLDAKVDAPLLGFQVKAAAQLSTFNPQLIAAGLRSWGDLTRPLTLPLLGDSQLRLFGAYRYRTWNGSLGEQNVLAAYGASLEDNGSFGQAGRVTGSYYWRLGFGNVQAPTYATGDVAAFWRGNAIGSLNLQLPLWRGQSAPATASAGLLYSPVPVVPGLTLNTNVLGSLGWYSNGSTQNTISLSGGPTLTLGQFSKPFFDFTQITVTAGGTLRQGASPLAFDRAVDLGTLSVGLSQQIAGPLVFSGGIGFNIDPGSPYYGDVTNSYVELRWQRRAYEIGVYYSPYQGLGGVRVRLNDFNFRGPGVPFIPWTPSPDPQQRPF